MESKECSRKKTSSSTEKYLQQLITFVPAAVVDHCTFNREQLKQDNFPQCDHYKAAIFFADITGFTSLNEKLAERGYSGFEIVARHLNEYFGHLIQVLNAHGGDLYKIAGDAIIAVFGGKNNVKTQEELCLRAVQCALEIQNSSLRHYNQDCITMSLHIGIATSEVCALHAGGVNNCIEYILAGEAFSQLETVVQQSAEGEVFVSPQTWKFIEPFVEGCKIEDNWKVLSVVAAIPIESLCPPPTLEVLAQIDERISSYIQPAVVERVKAGKLLYMAEFRMVTVLFVGLTNLTFVNPSLLQAAVAVLQKILFQYEGLIRQFLVDDKGSVCIGVFGAPTSHQDDPLRGVRAAQCIEAKLKEKGLSCTIGITTGKVYCGAVGNKKRQEYAVVGNSVNLAARLMKAAERQEGSHILCDFATYIKAKSAIGFHVHQPIQVKGKTLPITVFSPKEWNADSIQFTAPTNSVVIGRIKEKKTVEEKIDDTLTSKWRALIIEGRAGLGKSMLLEYGMGYARDVGVKVFRCCADAIDRHSPYLPWRRLFLAALEIKDANDTITLKKMMEFIFLQSLSSKYSQEHLCLLNSVFPLYMDDSQLSLDLTLQQRHSITEEMLLDLLQLLVDRNKPCVICIDDCHWLDAASISLLEQALIRVKSASFLMTARPDKSWNKHIHTNVETLRLSPMSDVEGRAMVAQIMKVDSISDMTWDVIAKRWGGNPFILHELAITLNSEGKFEVSNSYCSVFSAINIKIPDSVEGIVVSRIDSFCPTAQLILKVASVLGHCFTLEFLQAVYPIKEELASLLDNLLQIVDSGDVLLIEENTEEFHFTHRVVHNVVYNMLLISQRIEFHRSAASYLEKLAHSGEMPKWPTLAHHWTVVARLENPVNPITVETAIQWVFKSASLSQDCGAFTEAISKLNVALELAQRLTDSEPTKDRLINTVYFKLGQATQLQSGCKNMSLEYYNRAKLSSLSQTCHETFCFKRKREDDRDE